MVSNVICIRVDLDCSREVHWSVKNFSPRHGYFEATVGTVDKMGNLYLEMCQSWSSPKVKYECLRFPKELDLRRRSPLAKSVAMLASNFGQPCHFFHSCLNFSTRKKLAGSVNPSLKDPFCSQSYFCPVHFFNLM